MKILVVGGGGREHAIIRALKKSPDCGDIWCAPGNGGIGYDATCKNIPATDVDAMVAFAKAEAFDYVVVAQDDPLALGMVDALAKVGIPAFGPDAAAARIEASKVFSKDLMKKYGIPTAGYETFDDPAKVMDYIRSKGKYPVVIKADGLALGKGVLICQTLEEAKEGVDIRRDVFETVVKNGWYMLELKTSELSLEDIFLKLTMGEALPALENTSDKEGND